MARAASHSRACLRCHLAPSPGRLECCGPAAPGPCHPAPDGTLGAGNRSWDVVLDSCSVRAKRGGELTGPNPKDRARPGPATTVAVATDSLPLAVVPSAANVHDTRL